MWKCEVCGASTPRTCACRQAANKPFAVNVACIDIAKAIRQAEQTLGLSGPSFDRLSPQGKQHYIQIAQRALEAVRFVEVK